ncbi:MAG TPA: MFS transporter [Jatrophihabitans sp.]|jgi:EmrB/QacA subfamily drug resistance transporter
MSTNNPVLEASPRIDASHDPQYARRWWILVVLSIAQVMVVLDGTVVNIALPTAQRSLGFSDGDRQWIITAYSLAFGSLLLVGGRIADHFGRKWTFIVGLIGFAAASAVGGAAVNFGMLAAARAVQGAFGALLAPAALALLTTTFTDPNERGRAFGIFGGIAGGGASLGLLLGGLLTEYASWRWTMYVNLIFAGVASFGAIAILKHTRSAVRPKLDLPGTGLVTAGLFALVYGFSRAETDGWGDVYTLGFFVASVVLLVGFVLRQNRTSEPLLPLRILLDRNRGGAFLAMLLATVGMFAVFLFLTYYLQVSLGYSAVRTGLAFLPMTIILILVTGIASTVLMSRLTPRMFIGGGMFIGAIGLVLLTRIGVHSSYPSEVLLPTLVVGLGLGLVFAPAMSMATLGVQPEDSGVASAAVNTMQQVGGAIGTALFNTIAASVAASYIAAHLIAGADSQAVAGAAAVHSYKVAFWLAAAVFVAAAALTAAIIRPGKIDVAAQEHAVGLL